MKRTINEIRKTFIDFFLKKEHKILPGSSLVPKNDKTLLFTNAGMNQFKDVFLGKSNIDYSKIITVQNCLRTGGKHNDLENVGYTNYHHTFFEMLGNFSFGSYFKKESILYAWELLTDSQWFNLNKNKLIITVHSNDYETSYIWKNIIKISPEHIIKIGNKNNFDENNDNFWHMGDTGPCGPCTEIFYDKYDEHPCHNLVNKFKKNKSQYIEMWNIVFMQFHKTLNGSLIPLPTPSVDTGMGLERIASIIQNVNSNYHIDSFQILIQAVYKLCNVTQPNEKALQVISDHIRSAAFIISEDIIPSNENRGYILRKIIRRAMRYGLQLKIKIPFLYKLIPELIKSMEQNNSILKKKKNKIETTLKKEEINFSKTLNNGLKQLTLMIKKAKNNVLDGKSIFTLYDTFGFPIDLTNDICKEKKIKINHLEFIQEMKKQKKRSNHHKKFTTNYNYNYTSNDQTIFKGYNLQEITGTVTAIYKNQLPVNKLYTEEEGIVILNQTTFYGESGGQIGDTGILYNNSVNFHVKNTKKYKNRTIHIGILTKGNIKIHDTIISKINIERRKKIESNHTTTHLLHSALIKILGSHINQQGSLVNDKYLRFDFFHTQYINLELLNKIEELINLQIQKNILINTKILPLKDAKKQKIIGLFDHKYENNVRVVLINKFSSEICIGTHSKRTGNIGLFKIKSKTKIASNTYRIEGLTGNSALIYIQQQEKEISEIAHFLKQDKLNLKNKVQNLVQNLSELSKKNLKLEKQEINQTINKLEKNIIKINDFKIIIHKLKNKNNKLLRNSIYHLKQKLKSLIIVLLNFNSNNKVAITVGISKNLTDQINAINIVTMISKLFNGKGGGKVDMAEGGGKYTKKDNTFLNKIKSWIISKL